MGNFTNNQEKLLMSAKSELDRKWGNGWEESVREEERVSMLIVTPTMMTSIMQCDTSDIFDYHNNLNI